MFEIFFSFAMLVFSIFLLFVFSIQNGEGTTLDCVIRDFDQVDEVLAKCMNIVISNLTVPSGLTLKLDVKEFANITFDGVTTFEHVPWSGPLVYLTGSHITVQGAPGSVLNGQGELYWDHLGDKGPKKPQFMKIKGFNGTVIKDITIKNCPHHCIYIGRSDGLTIKNWLIDNLDGDKDNFTGHNTDGFDISAAKHLIIEDSKVINQDDCVVVRYGSDILIRNMTCEGGHGLSISDGFNHTSYKENVVANIIYKDSVVIRSANGIHVKTHADAYFGRVENITYENIKLIGITNFGINIQQDYVNGTSSGVANNNIPIYNLNLINIHGHVLENKKNSIPVYIFCGNTSCQNWQWSSINITGGSKSSSCNYTPNGYTC